MVRILFLHDSNTFTLIHRRSQGGPKGPWAPLNFKSNYKAVSKKYKFFCDSAGTLEFIVDL